MITGGGVNLMMVLKLLILAKVVSLILVKKEVEINRKIEMMMMMNE
jgi:hypothetical protein